MNILKKVFLSTIFVSIIFCLGILFLVKSNLGLRTIFFLSHYLVPELEVDQLIGTLNNFKLINVKYKSKNILLTIKVLQLNFIVHIFKKFYIDVNLVTCKNVNFFIKNINDVNFKTNGVFPLNLKSKFFSYFFIFFKDIRFYNFTANVDGVELFTNFFSSKGYWNKQFLELEFFKTDVVSINNFYCFDSTNNYCRFNSRNFLVCCRQYLKMLFNYFKKGNFDTFVNIDIANFSCNKIYLEDNKNISISKFFINFRIFKNSVNIKRLFFVFRRMFKVRINGFININQNYINLTINCVNKNEIYGSSSNIKIIIHGLWLSILKINFYIDKININFLIKRILMPEKLIFKCKLRLSNLNSYIHRKNFSYLNNFKLEIFTNSSEYFFQSYSVLNIKDVFPIKFCLLGIGNYKNIFLKLIKFRIFQKKILCNYEWKYCSNRDLVQKFLLNKFFDNLKKTKLLINIKKIILNNDFNEKILLLSSNFLNIRDKYIFTDVHIISGKNSFSMRSDFNSFLNLNVFFSIKDLKFFFPNFDGKFDIDVKIFRSINYYHAICKFIGNKLDFNIFKIVNIKFLIDINSKDFLNTIFLSVTKLFFGNLYVNHVFFKIKNEHDKRYLATICLSSYNNFMRLILDKYFNINVFIQTNVLRKINYFKFYLDSNVNKTVFALISYLFSNYYKKININYVSFFKHSIKSKFVKFLNKFIYVKQIF
ncbi:hypothetical protein [Buchnera aphidicola]|nr:hypothetical protein [Buchnera aphidicola]